MNDKKRAEFEKWFTSQIDSEYCSPNVKALMSECWKAAIASVVVELPPRLRGIDEQCRINNKAVDMMQQKLTEVGIRYE